MKSLARLLVLLLLPGACLLAAAGPARADDASEVRLIQMELFDPATNALVYRGVRESLIGDGRVTVHNTYTLPDGTPVQRSQSIYDRETLKLLYHHQTDLRSGEEEEVRMEGEMIHLRYREKQGAPERVEQLHWSAHVASSPVLAALMARNVDSLRAGKPLEFDLIVPSRLETISFRLLKEAERQLDGQPVTVIRMEPGSWLIRRLVNPMYFTLTRDEPHRLLQYQGRTSLRTPGGGEQDLRFVYRYPAQG